MRPIQVDRFGTEPISEATNGLIQEILIKKLHLPGTRFVSLREHDDKYRKHVHEIRRRRAIGFLPGKPILIPPRSAHFVLPGHPVRFGRPAIS